MSQLQAASFPRLSNGHIHIWTVSLHASSDQIGYLRSVLSDSEQRKASYFNVDHAQHSYIVSQAVLRILLAAYLDSRPEDIVLGTQKKGKPFVIHKHPVFFNISNSNNLCAYAFSPDAEVGIDIEKIRDLPDIDQLIERNLTNSEREYCLKIPGKKLSRFFQFWTFKESYLKAIGEGMRLTPENMEFSIENGEIRLVSVKYGFDATDLCFKGFEREGSYTGTLTYSDKTAIIREIEVSNLV